MGKRALLFLCVILIPVSGGKTVASAQEENSRIQVNVVLVQLSVAVTDHKGNYVSGLRPEDFAIYEKIIFRRKRQRLRKAMSRDVRCWVRRPPMPTLLRRGQKESEAILPRAAGANVFILFDTSNYMYRGFVICSDAHCGFHSLSGRRVNKVALPFL